MLDRRAELRLLCADVVEIEWKHNNGRTRRCTANLEDISHNGVGLQVETPVPLLTTVHLRHERGELAGKVKYCVLRETGYYSGVEFEQGCRWSPSSFRPRHLLNPRRLKT
jgi:hypothetical protein